MPQLADLVRHLARAADNNDDGSTPVIVVDNNTNKDSDHQRLEIGVIIAIIVAGLAVIGAIATCIVKRRKRQQKRAAKQANLEITWYGPEDEPRRTNRGPKKTEIAIGAALEGHKGSGAKPRKVAFIAEDEEAPPPSYEVVVSDKNTST